MLNLNRRDFLKQSGIGLGAVMASNLLFDRLLAGDMPPVGNDLLATRFGVTPEDIRKILQAALAKGGDFSEIFFEYRVSNGIVMEEDIIKSTSENITLGAGIRVLNGSQAGFGYTNDLTLEKLLQTATTAAAIAGSTSKVRAADLTVTSPRHQVYDMSSPLTGLNLVKKIDLVEKSYKAAQTYNSRIKKVQSYLGDELQYVAIANSEGLLAFDVRPQTRLSVSATAEEGSVRNTGRTSAGGRVGSDFFINVEPPEKIGKRAAEEAIILLSAKDAPAGEMPVVLSSRQSGVMIHEAVGHPLEADGNWKKSSIMADKMGTMVASELVTIYDDATIPNFRGSTNIDDEGTETVNVPLIEKGKLVGYLNDRIGAKMLGHKPNGHGRRETFRNVPIPRMNNTMLGKGDSSPEEIIASVKRGFYAETYQGGMVSDTGKFTFSVNMGYLIEDGKITQPLKNATLIGMNINILKDICMIGNDMGIFLGTCGKGGQGAAVTAGTPTLKISKMTVGGIA